ncbi:MAG: type II toxin-antitoxin system VapC family toxin [Terracidiphilus sp.]
MVIVDSSVWIDAINGVPSPHAVWLHLQVDREPVGLTSLILCEVLQGMRNEKRFRGVRDELSRLPVFENHSTSLAIQSAENYRRLRARGITIRKTIDCLIATFCIEYGFLLLHNDSDFDHFEAHLGLKVLDPSKGAFN